MTVKYEKEGVKDYKLTSFYRSNDNTCFVQKPILNVGDKFKKGDAIVDGPTMVNGEISIGTNLRAALMFFEGYNYEDSVIISDRIVKDDLLTSINIREHTVDIRDTELGPEIITADIPHVNDRILQKLDAEGIVMSGTQVKSGDILVGVVCPLA